MKHALNHRGLSSLLRSATVVGALGLGACLGNENGLHGEGSGLAGAGDSPTADGSGASNVDPSTGSPTQTAGGPLAIRRLLNRELVNVFRDVLGNDVAGAVDVAQLETDGTEATFDNDVSMQSMSATRLEGYMGAASAAANVALAPARIKATLGCPTATVDAACIDKFLPKIGKRLFRRPMTDQEVAQYKALFTSESDPSQGATVMLRALLSAPQLLYQPEIGTTTGAPVGYVRLTSYEVASKMSFLLLGTTPPDDLLAAADNDGLATSVQVAAAANLMLQKPAAKANLRYFATNWLGIGFVSSARTGLKNDTDGVHADMAEETLRLYDDFAAPGVKFSGFFSAPYTYVSTSLAPIYGVSSPQAGKWTKVDLTGKPRAGFLTQPSVLNATGIATFPAINRGKWVMVRLLCSNPGSPPANASQVPLPDSVIGGTEREQLAAHTSSASCASCHDSMDPIGFGFERYDAVGNYQTADAKGRPFSGQGALPGDNGRTFTDASQLGQQLANDTAAQLCVAQKLAQYLLGRAVGDGDAAIVAAISEDLRAKDVPTAVVNFVSSDAFLTRKVN